MKVLNPQQALVVLSVVTLSLGLQIAMLSLPLVILGGLLFLLVWRHWLALWQVPKALTMLAILSVLVLLWVQWLACWHSAFY
jgi:hypothetical protein